MKQKTKKTSFYCTFILFLGLVISFSSLSGQSNLTGTIFDANRESVPYANVLLLTTTDSTLFRGSVAGDNGKFEINNIPSGSYLLRVSMIGYVELHSEIFQLDGNPGTKDFGELVINEDVVLMNAAIVIAKKPLFEQRIDRMVVNVANSITSAGTTALEVLERSPGVMVNRQNDAISLSGKNGVVVMINGRINYMQMDAVVRMLEGMSSDNIERIEIITTPPAGFDAEGNAGYINIVLRKNLEEGFNGSMGGNVGFGKGIQASGNTNFNLRRGKTNFYGDYTYVKKSQDQIFAFYRRILL
ncbi:MAG: carboxypeptidase regulatory-like domain-containing protein, partial [Saprospiraceae bacterium]